MTKSAAFADLTESFRKDFRSSNYDERKLACDMTIIHYTDMLSAEAALQRLCDPASKVSAHFLVDETGVIFSLIDPEFRAWHAGVSFWKGVTDINSRSIGIELCNPGHSHNYRPFPSAQIERLLELLDYLAEVYNISRTLVLGHSDIAPTRKLDPGEFFPWRQLCESGFGLWPLGPITPLDPVPEITILQQQLAKIGYECPLTGQWDEKTKPILLAFQRHFQQKNVTGISDGETAAFLAGLMRRLNLHL